MMDEKYMVNDVLSQINGSLTTYADIIAQSANQSLRQTFQELRNNDENFQYELFKIAEQKGYYQPAQPATPTEITTVKNLFK